MVSDPIASTVRAARRPRFWPLLVVAAVVAWAAGTAHAQAAVDQVPLSTLDLSEMTTGWGEVGIDRNIVGRPLTIRGRIYEHGLGAHAPSKLRIRLAGGAERFTATVGIDDSAAGNGSVRFLVVADGKTAWESGVLGGQSDAVAVDLDLRGVQVLELRVEDAGDGSGYDHADWAEAALTMKQDADPPAVLPAYETVVIQTESFALTYVVGDNGRLYQQPIGGPADQQLNTEARAYPQGGDGYVFEPALQVVHANGDRSTALRFVRAEAQRTADGVLLQRIELRDGVYPLEVALCFRVHAQRDVIEQWAEITNREDGPVTLERMASSALAFRPDALHLTHFHGDWYDEMNPVTERLTPGMKVIDSKLGVRAHQFTIPSFILAMDGPATETTGRVLAGSLAWSGSFQAAFEHTGRDVRALVGVNPFGSSYRLDPGQTFTTPTMIWAYSGAGLGNMSRKLHAWARDHGIRDGHRPRATLLNNWEATGFDFDEARIVELLDPAKQIGAELFLLDDGWFGNKHPRVNDQAGLGDWESNRERFPRGLAPLAQAAVDRGLRFGIWIEPEMVNPKSELYERHPDWVVRQPSREIELQRSQMVLDNTRPEVRAFEWGVIERTLGVPGVSYAKWDANRYLTQPGSLYLPADQQTHLWIDYTRHLYDLMARTADVFPDIELMLCSGGGGRVDYGALKYFHEFWPSDNTDAVRRVTMQWDYSYFFPAIAMCSHVTHTGDRPMHFATAVAMSARFGMDLDVANLSEQERGVCREAIAAYKRIREVVHLGELYRVERPHDAARGVINYVSPDRKHAVVFVFQLKDGEADAVRPQGLDPDQRYTVTEAHPAAGRASLPDEGEVLTGRQIMQDGLRPAAAAALQATIIELTPVEHP